MSDGDDSRRGRGEAQEHVSFQENWPFAIGISVLLGAIVAHLLWRERGFLPPDNRLFEQALLGVGIGLVYSYAKLTIDLGVDVYRRWRRRIPDVPARREYQTGLSLYGLKWNWAGVVLPLIGIVVASTISGPDTVERPYGYSTEAYYWKSPTLVAVGGEAFAVIFGGLGFEILASGRTAHR
jgi:hypothetical protein